MPTFGIMYPNGSTTSTLGNWLLTKGHNLVLYSPVDPYTPLTRSLVLDLQIQAAERSRLHGTTDRIFEIRSNPDLEDCDYLVIPNLDVLPHSSDKDYVHMCMTTFRSVLY